MTQIATTLTKADVIRELWMRSSLKFKLHTVQKELYDLYHDSKEKTNVWLCGRRLGKSHTLVVIAIEECLKTPNAIVKLVCPTKTQMDSIVRPIFKQVLSDCPQLLMPKFSVKDYTYFFKNGSEIQLAGSDSGNAERLRGSSCRVAFVDEAGSCDDLETLIKDILLPCTLTTKGKIILASTPPKDPNHDFIKFIESAESKGTLITKTTYENPLIPPEELELLIQELGGKESSSYKREIMCELIRDANLAVIPEFTDSIARETIKEWAKPAFYDTYEAMDLGFRDLTVLLFAYYDFKNGKVVVEDELVINFQRSENTLPRFTKQIQDKEKSLWFNELTQEVKSVTLRVSDLNPIVTTEISRASNHSIKFMNAKKDDKEAAINQVRLMIASKKVIIHPRCKTLINHLKYATWQPNRKLFARTEEGSHYDAVDALCYLIRSIHYNRNPYPKNYGFDMRDLVNLTKEKASSSFGNKIDPKSVAILNSIFGSKKKEKIF